MRSEWIYKGKRYFAQFINGDEIVLDIDGNWVAVKLSECIQVIK